jgi:hypothetical protein
MAEAGVSGLKVTSVTTPLVIDAVEHTIWTRQRDGFTDLTGVIHHNVRLNSPNTGVLVTVLLPTPLLPWFNTNRTLAVAPMRTTRTTLASPDQKDLSITVALSSRWQQNATYSGSDCRPQ